MGEIKKQSISNTILSYLGAFIGFISLIYIQPYFLGAEKIGLLKLIYSFSWIVAMILPLGMGNVTMRFFPRFVNNANKHNGYFGLLLLIVSAGALLMLILFVGFHRYFNDYYAASPGFVPYFYYCFAFSYVFALITVFNFYSSSLLKTTFTVFLTDVYSRLAFIIIIFLYYFHLIDESGLVLSYILAYVMQLVFLVIYLLKLKTITLKINWSFYRSINKREIYIFAIIMTFGSFASMGVKIIDGLMLGHYINDIKIIGVYSVCAFIPTILEIPFNSLERIAQPKVAYAWNHNNTAEIQKIYEMSSRYLFFIGGALFCCLYASTDLIFGMLPPEYALGKSVFLILSLSSLLNLLTGINTTIITVSNKYFITSGLLIFLICAGVLINIWLIPIYGIKGAAIATFAAISAFNLLKYLYILIRFKMQPFSAHTLSILITIVVSLTSITLLPNAMHAFLRSLIGCSICLVLFTLLTIKCNTIEEINKTLRRFGIIK